jgi:hypothetical protein
MVLWAVLGGFVLDALFGDPAWLPHPVVLMGRCISRLEKFLRARLPGTPQGELLGGAVTAFCLPVGTFLVTSLVCLAAAKLSPWLGLAVQMFWCGQALAARGLAQESTNVYNELVRNDLPAARKAVSRIVGRDTQNLTAEGVTKAAVETVAENASDGVIAPLLYMLIGGAPLALTYKAINTMDSMLGYKNEKLAVQPRSWTTLPTTSPAALPPFCGWPLRPLPATMPRAHGASGGGTGATTPAPTAPRPKAPAPVHWACSWPARLTILANITPSPPSVMPCAPLSRRTSCAPTA